MSILSFYKELINVVALIFHKLDLKHVFMENYRYKCCPELEVMKVKR